ncbi:M23 family metallopeptidase [Acidipropionibacterium acidipropionici]|uniref:M23 family metallopeptidase n=1 Tax=Acidipropionibacterium acidipropionici TaxID=1748 RepID=UPI00110B1AB5|nr:M23 family metallopeptidase [Acidipropionibacterium acidipropionici]QCV96216.1 M23 family metallopeptidase [Acidipropionibacterium acidipropionici]
MSITIGLDYPFTGRWMTQNSPADRVPSHGTQLFATALAIDFVPVDVDGRTAPFTVGSLVRPEPPERFPGFGRPILAPADGVVVAAFDAVADHAAYRGLPSLRYAMTQRRRIAEGWPALAGNHVMIGCEAAIVALCHLRQGSIRVSPGQRVHAGERIGECGNTGNSTEPHVHIQAMDGPDPRLARPVAMTFRGSLPRNGEIIDAG